MSNRKEDRSIQVIGVPVNTHVMLKKIAAIRGTTLNKLMVKISTQYVHDWSQDNVELAIEVKGNIPGEDIRGRKRIREIEEDRISKKDLEKIPKPIHRFKNLSLGEEMQKADGNLYK